MPFQVQIQCAPRFPCHRFALSCVGALKVTIVFNWLIQPQVAHVAMSSQENSLTSTDKPNVNYRENLHTISLLFTSTGRVQLFVHRFSFDSLQEVASKQHRGFIVLCVAVQLEGFRYTLPSREQRMNPSIELLMTALSCIFLSEKHEDTTNVTSAFVCPRQESHGYRRMSVDTIVACALSHCFIILGSLDQMKQRVWQYYRCCTICPDNRVRLPQLNELTLLETLTPRQKSCPASTWPIWLSSS